MRVLLDTHAIVWALTDPDRLGPAAAPLIRDRSTDLVASAASAWEITTKVRIGKMPSAAKLAESYTDHLGRLGATELPITTRHALLAGSMQWDHRDPFDRMLAAQAIVEDLILVTVDAQFTTLPGLRLRW